MCRTPSPVTVTVAPDWVNLRSLRITSMRQRAVYGKQRPPGTKSDPAVVLVTVVLARSRFGPAWALLPVAALTLPAVAVATSGLRLTPRVSAATHAPATTAALSSTVYKSGLGSMLIDLRRTSFPAGGVVPLRRAGLQRR